MVCVTVVQHFLFGHGTRLRGKTYTSTSAKGVDDFCFFLLVNVT
jgi:hypothetical protein